ncbi:MAG: YdbH domain-containing protein [Sphingomonadales bacterium]|nr:YdbH domain-containing protein [Sphingomonadales bacterium]MDE2568338.1 YdbH domain-containing protein [Sphingomonadales bacterium]
MTETTETNSEQSSGAPRRRRRWRVAGVLAAVIAVLFAGLWLSRERIATHVIEGQLRSYGLPASYTIDTVGGGEEVLRDIRIGDPRHPDLTIERAAVTLVYGLGLPRIGTVTLTRPRLYGSYIGGKLSFGSLDKLLFGGPRKPVSLPGFDLKLDDGRALLLTDYGKVALKAEGQGKLSGGFAGTIGAVAPGLAVPGCDLGKATIYGAVTVKSGQPAFDGPLRLASLACAGSGVALGATNTQVHAVLDRSLSGVTGDFKLRGRHPEAGGAVAQTLALDGEATFRNGNLTGKLGGDAGGVSAPQAGAASLAIDGFLRTHDAFSRFEFSGTLDGRGVSPGPRFDSAMARAEQGAQGTLFAQMIGQVRSALARERRGSRLLAQFDARSEGGALSLVLPEASLSGGSGARLVSLSRFQYAGGAGHAAPRVTGNFSTGGAGLPRIAGRMEQGGPRGAVLRMTMAPYRVGADSLALPAMTLAQAPDGSLGFAGSAQMTGAIPGGRAEGLVLPVAGSLASNGELVVARGCVPVRFDRLMLGQMELDGRSLTLCPPRGTAIVRSGAAGLRIAAGVAGLDLSGRFGETPMRLASGPVGFAWPGAISARAVDVALGPPESATHFRLADLEAKAGKDFTGTFAGVDAKLAAVPVDVTNAAGDWRYADGALDLSRASFDVTDRQQPARFEKLVAQDATLSLHDNRIDANALLRDPASGREVARTEIRHDLSDSRGHADLFVDGLSFDKSLQPDTLTAMAKGLVALAKGTVTGKGEIDWNADKVTSSGRFSTDELDFAAPFGPVKGLKGTMVFTDLLGMVTAPDQTFTVASINPGIEVNDGVVTLSLLPGEVVHLVDAHWPFMGGTLRLKPTDLRLAIAEPRHYVLDIKGLDAAKFIEKMEFSNLSATGSFDGELPLVFTQEGGRIEGGQLDSRPPGGNVSYVGALTYKDLSTMANFAFDALKSLDYKHMTIAMNGSLSGEIVTNVGFEGVKQGSGAKRNFITKQLGKLPLRFVVNIRAPFYALIVNFKSFYDASYLQDPRALGLIDAKGRPIVRVAAPSAPAPAPTPSPGPASAALTPAKPDIQPPESEKKP